MSYHLPLCYVDVLCLLGYCLSGDSVLYNTARRPFCRRVLQISTFLMKREPLHWETRGTPRSRQQAPGCVGGLGTNQACLPRTRPLDRYKKLPCGQRARAKSPRSETSHVTTRSPRPTSGPRPVRAQVPRPPEIPPCWAEVQGLRCKPPN